MSREHDTYDRFSPSDRGRFGDNESSDIRGNDSVRSDLVDLTLVLHHGTAKAILVSQDGMESKAVWLPRSLVEIEHKSATVTGQRRNGQSVELATCGVTLTNRMAKEKGLI